MKNLSAVTEIQTPGNVAHEAGHRSGIAAAAGYNRSAS